MPAPSVAIKEGAHDRHIAIIGGGIMGASTAYYLSRAGGAASSANVRVTLIEESSSCAPGASGKSGGFLAEDWHGPDTADLARLSFRLHRELAKSEGGEEKWGYRPVETLSIAFDDSKSTTTATKSTKCPKEIASWVDGQYVLRSSNMGGGGTTAQATPLPLVEHLIEQAKASGKVDVLYSTRADKISLDAQGRVHELHVSAAAAAAETNERKSLKVDDVVIAAGPWTGSLIKQLLPSDARQKAPKFLKSAMRITGSRAHSIVVEAPLPTTAHCLFTDMHYARDFHPVTSRTHPQAAGAPEVYCRGDGTVYACGGSDDVPLPASADKVAFDEKQTASLIEQVAHLSPSHLATKSGAQITKQQACYLPIAPSGPIVAGDPSSGLYVAAGHSCWGITLGLGTGKVMRELLYGEKLSADISDLQK